MSGRCLAGKEIRDGKLEQWIRPVSGREHQEISEHDRRYEDGTSAGLLDIVSIPMLNRVPHTYQSENWLIAEQHYWKKAGTASLGQLEAAVDTVAGPLWINGVSQSNDRIPEAQAATLTNSLLLVKPTNLRIRVAPKGDPTAPNKRGVRARFVLNWTEYSLVLTDPYVERKYLNGEDGTYPVPNAFLCVSLGEPFNGYVYKLAAALITPDRMGAGDV